MSWFTFLFRRRARLDKVLGALAGAYITISKGLEAMQQDIQELKDKADAAAAAAQTITTAVQQNTAVLQSLLGRITTGIDNEDLDAIKAARDELSGVVDSLNTAATALQNDDAAAAAAAGGGEQQQGA